MSPSTYTFQVRPCASSRSKIVSAVLSWTQCPIGVFVVPPVGSGVHVAAVQNDRFMNVCDGTSQNQWSNTPNSRASPLSTGTCSGRVALHDLRVLVVGRLAAHLAGEEGDVVGHEAVHRRRRTLGRSVVRRRDVVPAGEAVVLVEDPEQLGVGVEVLLAGVGVGRIHVVAHVRRDPAAAVRRLVLRPLRHRIAQLPAEHPLERLAVARPVQVAQEVVQGAVLEEDDDDVIHGVGTVRRRQRDSSIEDTRRMGSRSNLAAPTTGVPATGAASLTSTRRRSPHAHGPPLARRQPTPSS